MPQQQYIKFLREVEGISIREIAEKVGIHWRTAKKYADRSDWNLKLVKPSRKSPVMEAYKEIVDTWLYEDRLLPRKQRHTAVRIFARLQQEHAFQGSVRTVSSYAGGVPERIWFDNLSAAVVRVDKHGERELTEACQRFSSHYRFEAVFCNPASGLDLKARSN